MVSDVYVPESGRGFRWNDPAFGIEWPSVEIININKRDREYPDFELNRIG
jgi:dTDP-4-dehydrorhamnose 3,5-epimerase